MFCLAARVLSPVTPLLNCSAHIDIRLLTNRGKNRAIHEPLANPAYPGGSGYIPDVLGSTRLHLHGTVVLCKQQGSDRFLDRSPTANSQPNTSVFVKFLVVGLGAQPLRDTPEKLAR